MGAIFDDGPKWRLKVYPTYEDTLVTDCYHRFPEAFESTKLEADTHFQKLTKELLNQRKQKQMAKAQHRPHIIMMNARNTVGGRF